MHKYLGIAINTINGLIITNQTKLFQSEELAVRWRDTQTKLRGKGRASFEFKIYKINQLEEITNE